MSSPSGIEFVSLKMPKRPRNPMSFKTKMEIIRRLSNGETVMSISRDFKVNESSIRTISKNAEKIKASVANTSPQAAGIISRIRNPILMKTETFLTEWIESQPKNELTCRKIREKALGIYKSISKKCNSDTNESFAASKGWYHNFRMRLNRQKNNPNQDLTADPMTNLFHWNDLHHYITTGGYSSQQIFNARETVFFWKRMPSKTYSTLNIDPQSANEKLRIFLCNNIDASFKCKPFIIHKSITDKISIKQEQELSAYCVNNKSGQMTDKAFENWFMESFYKEVQEYCENNELEFKILLLLDNASGYPIYLSNLNPNIKVLFLPMDISYILLPLHQSIITNVKLYYIKQLFTQMVDSIGYYGEQTVKMVLENLALLDGANFINHAWMNANAAFMNSSWQTLCNEGVCSSNFMEPDFSDIIGEIINLAKNINSEAFDDMLEGDIIELLEFSDEDVSEVRFQEPEDTSEEDAPKKIDKDGLEIDKLYKFFSLANKLRTCAIDLDPNTERSTNFVRKLGDALSVYRKIYV